MKLESVKNTHLQPRRLKTLESRDDIRYVMLKERGTRIAVLRTEEGIWRCERCGDSCRHAEAAKDLTAGVPQ